VVREHGLAGVRRRVQITIPEPADQKLDDAAAAKRSLG
jgi:hypothetical protein